MRGPSHRPRIGVAVLLILSVLAAPFLAATAAAFGERVYDSNTVVGAGDPSFLVWSGNSVAQSFTPSTTYVLLNVTLRLRNLGGAGNTVNITIRPTAAGVPSAAVLAWANPRAGPVVRRVRTGALREPDRRHVRLGPSGPTEGHGRLHDLVQQHGHAGRPDGLAQRLPPRRLRVPLGYIGHRRIPELHLRQRGERTSFLLDHRPRQHRRHTLDDSDEPCDAHVHDRGGGAQASQDRRRLRHDRTPVEAAVPRPARAAVRPRPDPSDGTPGRPPDPARGRRVRLPAHHAAEPRLAHRERDAGPLPGLELAQRAEPRHEFYPPRRRGRDPDPPLVQPDAGGHGQRQRVPKVPLPVSRDGPERVRGPPGAPPDPMHGHEQR